MIHESKTVVDLFEHIKLKADNSNNKITLIKQSHREKFSPEIDKRESRADTNNNVTKGVLHVCLLACLPGRKEEDPGVKKEEDGARYERLIIYMKFCPSTLSWLLASSGCCMRA